MKSAEIKIVGSRTGPVATFGDVNDFLEMIVQLRAGKPFIPKGVYRFRSHDESQRWSIKMMARQKSHSHCVDLKYLKERLRKRK